MTPETPEGQPTNLSDLMAKLIAPPEPSPISLVPQTLAWPILCALVFAVLVYGVIRWLHHRKTEAYRRAALSELDAAVGDSTAVASLLRQTALMAFPRKDVASLYGTEWLAFLDATCDGVNFRSAAGAALATAPYAKQTTLPEATVAQVRRWISHHRRARPT